MILVEQSVHATFAHTGGFAVWNRLLELLERGQYWPAQELTVNPVAARLAESDAAGFYLDRRCAAISRTALAGVTVVPMYR
jgi:hypothetical protein